MTPTKRGRSNSMFDLGLDKEKEELVARVATLARERFAPRAAAYDRDAAFPAEDFVDLFKAGLFGASIPREYGGLGLGPYFDDTFTLWMMTKELAKADLSLARCWEGHINSLVLLAGLATDAQKARWFDGVTSRSEKWVAWSGEPQARTPQQKTRPGTAVKRVDGGYVIDGSKVFATSAALLSGPFFWSTPRVPVVPDMPTVVRKDCSSWPVTWTIRVSAHSTILGGILSACAQQSVTSPVSTRRSSPKRMRSVNRVNTTGAAGKAASRHTTRQASWGRPRAHTSSGLTT